MHVRVCNYARCGEGEAILYRTWYELHLLRVENIVYLVQRRNYLVEKLAARR